MAEIKDILENDEKLSQVTKSVFDSVDTDGSGKIDKKELKTAMIEVSKAAEIPPPSDDQIQAAFNALDVDLSGDIDVVEFKVLVRQLLGALAD